MCALVGFDVIFFDTAFPEQHAISEAVSPELPAVNTTIMGRTLMQHFS